MGQEVLADLHADAVTGGNGDDEGSLFQRSRFQSSVA